MKSSNNLVHSHVSSLMPLSPLLCARSPHLLLDWMSAHGKHTLRGRLEAFAPRNRIRRWYLQGPSMCSHCESVPAACMRGVELAEFLVYFTDGHVEGDVAHVQGLLQKGICSCQRVRVHLRTEGDTVGKLRGGPVSQATVRASNGRVRLHPQYTIQTCSCQKLNNMGT